MDKERASTEYIKDRTGVGVPNHLCATGRLTAWSFLTIEVHLELI